MWLLDRWIASSSTTRYLGSRRAPTLLRGAGDGLQLLAPAGAKAQGVGAPSPAAGARDPSWVHESWTVKDGLPVNSINALLQDRTGYIWAATFDGLVRFDGLRFTVFNSANSEELPSNRIIQLKEGRDGSLWLATEQGHIVRFRAGRFTQHRLRRRETGRGLADPVRRLGRHRLGRDARGAVDGPARPPGPRGAGNARRARHRPSCSGGTEASGSAPIGAGIFRVTGDGRGDEGGDRSRARRGLRLREWSRTRRARSGSRERERSGRGATGWCGSEGASTAVLRQRLSCRCARQGPCLPPPRPACTGSIPTRPFWYALASSPYRRPAVGGCRRALDRRRAGRAPRRSTGLHAPGAPHRIGRPLRPRRQPLARHRRRRAASPQAGALHDLQRARRGAGTRTSTRRTWTDRVRSGLARGGRARAASTPSRVASRFSGRDDSVVGQFLLRGRGGPAVDRSGLERRRAVSRARRPP